MDKIELKVEENTSSIEVIELLKKKQCVVLRGSFTKEECRLNKEHLEKQKFQELKGYSKTYRNNSRIMFDSEKYAETFWDKIKKGVDSVVFIDTKTTTLSCPKFTHGIWIKSGLNPRIRACKYVKGQFFKKHIDSGYHPHDYFQRTMKTCMLYVNDDYTGGETTFYFPNGKNYNLKAKAGDTLVFNQEILHEGQPIKSGNKYIVRTDIYYSLLTNTTRDLTKEEKKKIIKIVDNETKGYEFKNNDLDPELMAKIRKEISKIIEINKKDDEKTG